MGYRLKVTVVRQQGLLEASGCVVGDTKLTQTPVTYTPQLTKNSGKSVSWVTKSVHHKKRNGIMRVPARRILYLLYFFRGRSDEKGNR